MGKIIRNTLFLCTCLVAGMPVASAQTGSLKIQSQHDQRSVEGQSAYLWLKAHQMMQLEVHGPIDLGLRLYQVLRPGHQPGSVDLTVVRDDVEQGTVRFRVPQGKNEFSGQVLVRIDVPSGRHAYRLLISGSSEGVLVLPFTGSLDSDTQAIIATPGGDREAVSKPKRRPAIVRRSVERPRIPQVVEPDLLEPIASVEPDTLDPETYLIVSEPGVTQPFIGPGALTSGGLAGALALGAASLAIVGSVQTQRAEDEAVQILAGEHYDRAQRSYQAAAVFGGLAGAAVLTAVVFYLIEESPAAASLPTGSLAGFTF